jgi:hypothetical protein
MSDREQVSRSTKASTIVSNDCKSQVLQVDRFGPRNVPLTPDFHHL